MKYQLLRISEILVTWAKFSKSDKFEELYDKHNDLLIEKYDYQTLETIKNQYWDIILKSGDMKLYGDLKSYFNEDSFSGEPTSMTSIS